MATPAEMSNDQHSSAAADDDVQQSHLLQCGVTRPRPSLVIHFAIHTLRLFIPRSMRASPEPVRFSSTRLKARAIDHFA